MLQENLQYLRHLKGFTLVETSAYLNNILNVDIQSKFYQTKDKLFTYERKTKPIEPKAEVLNALCKLYAVTETELLTQNLKKLDIKSRWDHAKNIVEDEQAHYKIKNENEKLSTQIENMNIKLDLLIKMQKSKK